VPGNSALVVTKEILIVSTVRVGRERGDAGAEAEWKKQVGIGCLKKAVRRVVSGEARNRRRPEGGIPGAVAEPTSQVHQKTSPKNDWGGEWWGIDHWGIRASFSQMKEKGGWGSGIRRLFW